MAMLIGLAAMLGVSYLTEWLMDEDKMDRKWLKMVNNRVDSERADAVPDYELNDADDDKPEVQHPLVDKIDS